MDPFGSIFPMIIISISVSEICVTTHEDINNSALRTPLLSYIYGYGIDLAIQFIKGKYKQSSIDHL